MQYTYVQYLKTMKSGQLIKYNCWEIIHKCAGENVPGPFLKEQSWVYLGQLSKFYTDFILHANLRTIKT